MDLIRQDSPRAVRGRGFEALGIALAIALITVTAWNQLWFGPAFNEGMRNLFAGTHPPPPTLAQKFTNAWQWVLAATGLGSATCVVLRSKWMRLASILWCGSLVILAVGTSVSRGITPIVGVVLLSAVATTIGVEVFRARAV